MQENIDRIKALKIDLNIAKKGLIREKYNHTKALERMLEYEGAIECIRDMLGDIGIKTHRKKPWGFIKYIKKDKNG